MRFAIATRQAGFSLIDVMVALALFTVVITALMGYHRVISRGLEVQWQYQQLWRYAHQQADLTPPDLPPGWQVNRVQTSSAGCVSITATVISPVGRQAQLVRFHCRIT